jgi:hypothetical protein
MSNDDTNADDNLEAVDSFDDLNADSDDIQQVDSFSDLDSQSSDGELDYVPTDSFDALDDEADSPSQVDDTTSNASPAEQLATPADDATASDGGATIGEALSDSPTAPVQDADADLLPEDDSELHDFDFGDDEPVAVETKQPAIDEVDTDNAVPNEAAAESESAAVSSEIPEVPACTRLVISPSPSSVMAGEQVAFSVEAFDNDGGVVEKPDVRWTAKGGTIDKEGAFTADLSGGLFSVKVSTAGTSDRVEGVVEALPVQNEWVLASFFSACGIYMALAMIYLLDPAVLGPSKNFIGYINFDWAIATILVGPCLICFISSSLGLLSKPKGKEWLLLLPSLGPVIPVVLGALSVMAFF